MQYVPHALSSKQSDTSWQQVVCKHSLHCGVYPTPPHSGGGLFSGQFTKSSQSSSKSEQPDVQVKSMPVTIEIHANQYVRRGIKILPTP
jgi:hypothetical protein